MSIPSMSFIIQITLIIGLFMLSRAAFKRMDRKVNDENTAMLWSHIFKLEALLLTYCALHMLWGAIAVIFR